MDPGLALGGSLPGAPCELMDPRIRLSRSIKPPPPAEGDEGSDEESDGLMAGGERPGGDSAGWSASIRGIAPLRVLDELELVTLCPLLDILLVG